MMGWKVIPETTALEMRMSLYEVEVEVAES